MVRTTSSLLCIERALKDHERYAQLRAYELAHPMTAQQELEWLAQDWIAKASRGARALPPMNALTLLNIFQRR
jgi:hypothetical protein